MSSQRGSRKQSKNPADAVGELKKKLKSAKAEQNDVNHFKAELDGMGQKLKKYQEQRKNMQKQISNLQKRTNSNAKRDVKTKRENIKTKETKIKDLKKQISDQKKRIKDAEVRAKTLDPLINAYTIDLAMMKLKDFENRPFNEILLRNLLAGYRVKPAQHPKAIHLADMYHKYISLLKNGDMQLDFESFEEVMKYLEFEIIRIEGYTKVGFINK